MTRTRVSAVPGPSAYTSMQKDWYEAAAEHSSYEADKFVDNVVGSYDAHNSWKDYDNYLLGFVDESFKKKLVLDFGCGPGRNIIKYSSMFRRLDGADISKKNLINAAKNLEINGVRIPKLYVTNGRGLTNIPTNTYHAVISSICLQHICVHSIRLNILKGMFRVLRAGGLISIQMGYGESSDKVPYKDDYFAATATNGCADTIVSSPDDIGRDLSEIGFSRFSYSIRPCGPGDTHPNWIFFQAFKST